MNTPHTQHAKIFKALCDEKRLAILSILRGGECCACVLMEQLEMGQSALSYHMKILCQSGLVIPRQEGKWVHYRLDAAQSQSATALLRSLTTPHSAV